MCLVFVWKVQASDATRARSFTNDTPNTLAAFPKNSRLRAGNASLLLFAPPFFFFLFLRLPRLKSYLFLELKCTEERLCLAYAVRGTIQISIYNNTIQ